MKKIFLLFIPAFLLLNCRKNDNPEAASWKANGVLITANYGFVDYQYSAGKFLGIDFTVGTNINNIDVSSLGQSTNNDSLYVGKQFTFRLWYSQNSYWKIHRIDHSTGNIYLTITRNSSGTMDGNFTGHITGVDAVTGANIDDTITEGHFINLPLKHEYQ